MPDKRTTINPEKIARLRDPDVVHLHERLHQLFAMASIDGDEELAQRVMRAHQRYRHEMLQRGIDHPYLDDMDGDALHEAEDLPDADDAEANTNATEHDHGIMLAFFLPQDVAQRIVQEGGESPEELHLTLVYLGHTDDWDAHQLKELPGLVSAYAANSQPMSGAISGMGRFASSSSSNSRDVLYHSVDLPALPAWRQGLVEWLDDGGFPQKSEHGYTPHVTVKYLSPDEPAEIGGLETIPITFGELVCKIGPETYRFPLASRQGMRPQRWADKLLASQEMLHESRTSRSVFSSDVRRRVEAHDDGQQLHAGDGAGRDIPEQGVQAPEIIYGVLLVPDEPDLEGDQFPADMVRQACEDYSNKLEADEQHRFANPDLEVADSFIAPEGYQIDGNTVKPGSWVVGIKTQDPEVIAKVKSGDYRGLSIDGTAVVRARQ
jgi:2'-5' RNA ligase